MKLLALFFIFIFIVGMVSAQDVVFAPFNKEFNVVRTCFNNNTHCSSTAVCNLTIIYPENGVLLINNELMTNLGAGNENFTLHSSQLNQLGDHRSTMVCFDSGGQLTGNGFDNFILRVTADGRESSPFPFQFMGLIVGVLLIFVGKSKDELGMFQMMGSVMVMLFGVITLYPGYSSINYSNLFGQGIGVTSLGMGFYFLIEKSFSRENQQETFEQKPEDLDDGRLHD